MVQTFFVGVREAENILPIVGDRGNLVLLFYHVKSNICDCYLLIYHFLLANKNCQKYVLES